MIVIIIVVRIINMMIMRMIMVIMVIITIMILMMMMVSLRLGPRPLLIWDYTKICTAHPACAHPAFVIIITRPRPAFGRLGLGGLSGGHSSHG